MLDRRTLYKAIRMIENSKKTTQLSEYLISLKRCVRRTNNYVDTAPQIIFLNNDGLDGWCEKTRFPKRLSRAEKENYVAKHRLYRPYSDHDCTGKVFTDCIKVFDVPNHTIIYHFKSVDV